MNGLTINHSSFIINKPSGTKIPTVFFVENIVETEVINNVSMNVKMMYFRAAKKIKR
jgi:hypothetical protein